MYANKVNCVKQTDRQKYKQKDFGGLLPVWYVSYKLSQKL